jgi:hypothetical protein
MSKPTKSPTEPSKLLWVKLPQNHSDKLKDAAVNMGISRADLMRLILIHYVQNGHTFTITK